MPTNGNRSLDRTLRAFRGHIRTHNLLRPDRLVISTLSRSVHTEFTSASPVDRFAAVLLWTVTLQGVSFGLTFGWRDEVRLAATGRTRSGLSIGLACSASVLDLGGTVERVDHRMVFPDTFAHLHGLPVLTSTQTDAVSFDELATLVAHARTLNAAETHVLGVVA